MYSKARAESNMIHGRIIPEQSRMTGKVVSSRSSCREKRMYHIVLCCGLLKDGGQCEETLHQKEILYILYEPV